MPGGNNRGKASGEFGWPNPRLEERAPGPAERRINHAGKQSDFDGDGKAEVPVASPWGMGILKLSGNTLSAP